MLTLISLFLFLTTGGNIYPWTHPLVLLAGICTIIFAATFCYNESKVEKAVLPLYLLFEFPVRNIMFTGFLSSMINYTVSEHSELHIRKSWESLTKLIGSLQCPHVLPSCPSR